MEFMSFDKGTWWLVAGLIAVAIWGLGKLMNLVFVKIILEPIQDFKQSVEKLTNAINELREFIVKQDEKNKSLEQSLKDVSKKISDSKNDTEKKINEVWDEIEEANEKLIKQDLVLTEVRKNLEIFKVNQEKFNKEVKNA